VASGHYVADSPAALQLPALLLLCLPSVLHRLSTLHLWLQVAEVLLYLVMLQCRHEHLMICRGAAAPGDVAVQA